MSAIASPSQFRHGITALSWDRDGGNWVGLSMLNVPGALAGCKVFPCVPGGKFPATRDGWKEATSDGAKLAEWAAVNPDFNWACATGLSGLFVIDVDPQGLAFWDEMQRFRPDIAAAIERAYKVRTPRGGLHIYWYGQGPTTASRIAPGIDTRGGIVDSSGVVKSGGYVLLPGSRTSAGEYIELGGVLEQLPDCIRELIPERKKGQSLGLERDLEKDNPRNIKWARDLLSEFVKSGRVSVEGQGGDNTLFAVIAQVMDKGVSPAMAFELLADMWNPHCLPPWDEDTLELKIGNVLKYSEEGASGAKGFQTNESAFAHIAGQDFGQEAIEEPKTERRRTKLQWIDDYADSVADPSWFLPGFLPDRGTGILYGASGSYKSFLALDMACCLAHGHAGQWGAPPVENDVIYLAGEAPVGMARLRRPAWREWQGVKGPGRLAIFPKVPPLDDKEGWQWLKDDIGELGLRPKLFWIDTYSRLMAGFDENATQDANRAVAFIEQLSQFYDCLVMLLHHTGKDESKGARGNSALFASVDSALYLKKTQVGTSLVVKKHKDADAPDNPYFLETRKVGQSIVLARVEHGAADLAKKDKPKISWAERGEVAAFLQRHGEMRGPHLFEAIAKEYGVAKDMVARTLKNNPDLAFLKEGDLWRVPKWEF